MNRKVMRPLAFNIFTSLKFWMLVLVGLLVGVFYLPASAQATSLSSGQAPREVSKSFGFRNVDAAKASQTGEGVVINELVADNESGLLDEDGHAEDWIELHNSSDMPVELSGWSLTDDEQHVSGWILPAVTLPAHGYLVIFASGKDRALAGGELHTNFTLNGSGEYLALLDADGQIRSEFSPFAALAEDEAYGRLDDHQDQNQDHNQDQNQDQNQNQDQDQDQNQGDGLTYLEEATPGAANSGAKTASRPVASGPVRSQVSNGSVVINELVADNENGLLDEDGEQEDWLELHNISGNPVDLSGWYLTDDELELTQWAFPTMTLPADGYLVVFASKKDRAVAGSELHANFKLSDNGEYLALVQADGVTVEFEYAPEYASLGEDQAYGLPNDTDDPAYLETPTPGGLNSVKSLSEVSFSRPSGVFTETFDLTLSAELASGEAIHYTTDGSEPTGSASIYNGPITIADTMRVRARVITTGREGPIGYAAYTELDPSIANVDSDLPLIVIDTFGATVTNSQVQTPILTTVIDRDGARAQITGQADYSGSAGLRVRGSSSQNFPKKQYKLELWDDNGGNANANLLGLGKESDWVLYAPGRFDRAMINDPLMYQLAADMGLEGMSTQFVELYFNDGSGAVTADDYDGLYILIESIKIDKKRIDIEKMSPTDTSEPEITGGYIISIDRQDNGQHAFLTNRGFPNINGVRLNVTHPKLDDLNSSQIDYIEGYINDFEDALYGPNFKDPTLGYAAYIDVDSWIDSHIVRVLAKDPDVLRLSNYFYKDRNGKLVHAPVWDVDRTLDSADSRNENPVEMWDCCDGIDPLIWGWWGRLFEDQAFQARYRARWLELRQNELSESNLFARMDTFHAEITEAYPREDARWGSTPNYGSRFGDLQGEIDNMKGWLSQRLTYLDQVFAKFALINVAQGQVATQSSTASGGVASRAVDGNTHGKYQENSVTHTNNEFQAWWEVDLGAVYELDTVRLWNRKDCCADRLSDFHLLLSDTPFVSTNLAQTQAQSGVSDYAFAGTAGELEEFAVNRTARYVRVQLAGSNSLSLAEVQVLRSNQLPLITNPGAQSNTEDDAVNLTIDATDADEQLLTYSASGLPTGLSIGAYSGQITGILSSDSIGTHNVSVSATDGFDSASASFTWTVGARCPVLQEAEHGVLSGDFVIANDNDASAEQYIHVPNGSGNRFNGPDAAQKADYCFIVETAGTYRIKAGAYAQSGRDNSFYVQVDGAPSNGYLWDVPRNTTYNMNYVSNRNGDDPVEVTLSAGEHTVSIFLREDGTRLDQIELEYVEDTPPPPPPTCDGLVVEAEAGVLTGDFVVANDQNASGGQYIHVPNGSGNSFNSPNPAHMAQYCFNVETAGIYRLKGWVYGATGREDSFFVQVNSMPVSGYLWDFKKNTSYQMDFLSDRNGADPVEIALAAGEHLVTVFLREDGARLDKLELEPVENTPPPTCSSQLLAEAESGSLTGDFVIGSDPAASGGEYIHVPEGAGNSFNSPNPNHQAQYCFTVATAGTYRIKGWAYADTGQDNSFFVQADATPANGYQWSFPMNSTYQLDYVSDEGGADPVEVSLSAGDHIITVFLREDGARLDKLELELLTQSQNTSQWIAKGLAGTLLVDNNDDHLQPDEQELDLANISLTLVDAQTGGQKYQEQTHSNHIGQFDFDQMPVGEYLLTADLPARYATRQRNTFTVTVNAQQMVEISLELQQVEENTNEIYLPLLTR
ncbi:MAG: CotH kinase family protein [Ardenticatenaceae bacterium]